MKGSVSYDLDKLERNLNDAFALLAEMGVSDDGDALNLNMKKKKRSSESLADPEALTAEDEEYLNREDVVSYNEIYRVIHPVRHLGWVNTNIPHVCSANFASFLSAEVKLGRVRQPNPSRPKTQLSV